MDICRFPILGFCNYTSPLWLQEGSGNFPISWKPPRNFRQRKSDMKQFSSENLRLLDATVQNVVTWVIWRLSLCTPDLLTVCCWFLDDHRGSRWRRKGQSQVMHIPSVLRRVNLYLPLSFATQSWLVLKLGTWVRVHNGTWTICLFKLW